MEQQECQAIVDAWQARAKEWYNVDEVQKSINRRLQVTTLPVERHEISKTDGKPIPTDVTSRAFAEWLTEEFRHAMAKGMQLAHGIEKPRWMTGEEAKQLPTGYAVLIRRKIDGETWYEADNYHRPDLVDNYTGRPGEWAWCVLQW